jgi:hypothetical protein
VGVQSPTFSLLLKALPHRRAFSFLANYSSMIDCARNACPSWVGGTQTESGLCRYFTNQWMQRRTT